MAAISRRGQGGRIYNNTRTRERLRRKCVKPADLTTHSSPKARSRPRTATRPARALSLPHAARCIPRRPHNPFPAEGRHPPPHSDAPSPNTSAPPRSPDARPQAARYTPADRTTHSPPKTVTRSRTTTRPSRTLSHPLPLPSCHIPAAPTHTRRLRDTFLVEDLLPSPSVPLRAQKNGTAQWMCDAECLGRPSLRSVIGVGEPRAVRRRCGALAWRVGLRPQPWALRSRRCGRVLRA